MIQIKNIYYMLAYAYRVLNKDQYKKIASEEFDYTADLLAAVLVKSLHYQMKRGLIKNYVEHTEPRTSPKGKINVAESMKVNTYMKKQLSCSYDIYTENTYMNQVLKSTILLLIQTDEVSIKNKKALKKIAIYFSYVHQANLHRVRWSAFTYHKNNATYEMLMNLCYLIIQGLLLTEQEGEYRLASFLKDEQMHALYERFVLEYYKKHYPELKPSAPYIKWDVDDGFQEFLPSMQTDITLTNGKKILIIDTKMYQRAMQSYYQSTTFHSHNMYQIFSYVKNRDVTYSGNVSGVLLYAKTDEAVVPNHEFSISGNTIAVKTLDLGDDFGEIEKQLDEIVRRFVKY